MDDLDKQHPRPWRVELCNAGVQCFDANGWKVWTEWDAGLEIASAVVKAYNERALLEEKAHE